MTNKRKKELKFEAAFLIVSLEERLLENLERDKLSVPASDTEVEYSVKVLYKLLGSAYARGAKMYERTGGTLS